MKPVLLCVVLFLEVQNVLKLYGKLPIIWDLEKLSIVERGLLYQWRRKRSGRSGHGRYTFLAQKKKIQSLLNVYDSGNRAYINKIPSRAHAL